MHVMLISACEKRALKRTRAVLDSYAIRTGPSVWASPMTQEGLREVRAALKRSATRQTAVACYRNDGRMRMKLLWIVGSRCPFGPNGHFPAGATTQPSSRHVAEWVRVTSLLAQAGGWCHDLGKASVLFQRKLEGNSAQTDPARHEWVSMRLLQAMRDEGLDWDAAWIKVASHSRWHKSPPLGEGLNSAQDALDYLIVTHHRLLGPEGKVQTPDHSRHVTGTDTELNGLKPKATLSAKPWESALALLKRIDKHVATPTSAYWRGVATLARAGLIFADHIVSAERKPCEAPLYANTHEGQLNQSLDWHLGEVARVAGDSAFRIATLQLPGLTEDSVESICQPAAECSSFSWQNRAANALASWRERSLDRPMLVLNMAGTGSGKTRMNARAACILSHGPVRFAVALNLRTLTLQTGDAYRHQLGIGADEMACIIGDRVSLALHENHHREEQDVDGNEAEENFEAANLDFPIPEWMEPFANRKPYFRAVVGAPLLVSTVDFLDAAGVPYRQGHHVAALLRFADSDLILDEVDGYDPKPLVAVLRLVQLAARFGRNVICSTATLAEPVARAIHAAYQSGAEMLAALKGAKLRFGLAMIDDHSRPVILEEGTKADFSAFYRSHLNNLKPLLGQQRERIPYLQVVANRTISAWQAAVESAVRQLHGDFSWTHPVVDKRVSFGLVRMANIAPAIETARYLAQALPNARVACYHANDLVIQRYLKEKTLDRLLTRKGGKPFSEAMRLDPDIIEWLTKSESSDVPFIVVATPVEEIGRDHDFDWAVIEPSSVRSIVQTAGRVNRHRRESVRRANVAILQFNQCWVSQRTPVFCRPGFESAESTYGTHDLGELLNWDRLTCLDARLMFDGHPFAEWDERSIESALKIPMHRFFQLEGGKSFWIGQGIYDKYPLREDRQRLNIHWDGEKEFRFLIPNGKNMTWLERSEQVNTLSRVENDWLVWNPSELLDTCHLTGIHPTAGMVVTMEGHSLNELIKADFKFDQSFGFVRQ